MKDVWQLLVRHPYIVLFLSGLLERTGVPLLLSPILVAAGVLAAGGQARLDVLVWVTLVACVVGDTLWFEMGRRYGDSVLSFLCRISLEPDSCVRRSKVLFDKGTDRTLFFSKWIPGISHIIPSIAGVAGIRRERFLFTNTLGSFFWIVVMILAGYIPVQRLHPERLVPEIGPAALEGILALLVLNLVLKYVQKERFIKQLAKVRIEPEELKRRLDEGESVVILDLRHALDSISDPRVIPGAVRILPEEVEENAGTLPRGAEIILYCT